MLRPGEFHTKVVGTSKKNEDDESIQKLLKDISEYCCEGWFLSLEHESDNQYDENAIKVYCHNDHIGYINRELAKDLAPLVDQQRVEAEISEITGGEDGKSFGCNILIRIVPEGETARTESLEYVHLGESKRITSQANNFTPSTPASIRQSQEAKESYFDGGLLQLIGWTLLGILVTICTLGICFPWAVCMICRWETKHTVINGHRLVFDGTAFQLFGNWIKWFLLTLITFGIYGFWVGIKVKKWTTKHTHFETPVPLSALMESSQSVPSTPAYTPPSTAPSSTPWEAPEKDWTDKIAPILPLVYVLWFCGIAVGTFFLLSLII